MDTFPTIKVATAYIDPATGKELESFPASLELLADVEVKYVELKGWEKPITGIKNYEDLPAETKTYIKFIEDFIGIPVKYIGTGPGKQCLFQIHMDYANKNLGREAMITK